MDDDDAADYHTAANDDIIDDFHTACDDDSLTTEPVDDDIDDIHSRDFSADEMDTIIEDLRVHHLESAKSDLSSLQGSPWETTPIPPPTGGVPTSINIPSPPKKRAYDDRRNLQLLSSIYNPQPILDCIEAICTDPVSDVLSAIPYDNLVGMYLKRTPSEKLAASRRKFQDAIAAHQLAEDPIICPNVDLRELCFSSHVPTTNEEENLPPILLH